MNGVMYRDLILELNYILRNAKISEYLYPIII